MSIKLTIKTTTAEQEYQLSKKLQSDKLIIQEDIFYDEGYVIRWLSVYDEETKTKLLEYGTELVDSGTSILHSTRRWTSSGEVGIVGEVLPDAIMNLVPYDSVVGNSRLESLVMAIFKALYKTGNTWRELTYNELCEILKWDQVQVDFYKPHFPKVVQYTTSYEAASSFSNAYKLLTFKR